MDTPQPQILIVDDDREIRDLLAGFLDRHGYRVRLAADGRTMKRELAEWRVDLVVLDLMLPGEDGLSLCRELRARSALPVVILTALGEDTERIIGLEMGADDYLAKPFNPRELLARIRAVLRRSQALPAPGESAPRRLDFEGWRLDLERRELRTTDEVLIPLTGAEFELLAVLAEHPNRVLSRDQLLDLTRGRDSAPFDRSVDVLISRLRRKLGDDPRQPRLIQTVRAGGYRLCAPVERR